MKHQDFWLYADYDDLYVDGYTAQINRETFHTWEIEIHAIEYAAYTDALKMLEEMAFALETTMAFGNGLVAQTTVDKYRAWLEGMK